MSFRASHMLLGCVHHKVINILLRLRSTLRIHPDIHSFEGTSGQSEQIVQAQGLFRHNNGENA